MADVKPFDFGHLPKISLQEAKLLNDVSLYLPRAGFSGELGRSIRQLMTRLLSAPFSFRMEKIQTVSLSDIVKTLPPQGIYTRFGLAPLDSKAVLELDPFLSHVAIDRLLGGEGELPERMRPLTEIEEGILSYLFLKVLSEIFERLGRSARIHFRLEGIFASPEEVVSRTEAVLILFRLELGNRSGYARLFLPSPVVRKVFLEPLEGAQAASGEQEFSYYAARLANLGFLETGLWAEAGSSTLKARELRSLEAGDVVLLERTEARIEKGSLTGFLPLRVGRGEHGGFRGEVVSRAGPLQVKLEGMELEHPV